MRVLECRLLTAGRSKTLFSKYLKQTLSPNALKALISDNVTCGMFFALCRMFPRSREGWATPPIDKITDWRQLSSYSLVFEMKLHVYQDLLQRQRFLQHPLGFIHGDDPVFNAL